MKKYFCVSDVHGFYSALEDALNKAGFDKNNPDHIFVSCGDLLDRGSQPLECLTFVNNLPKDRKILIRGNHEDLIEEALARHDFRQHDYHNGTVMTVFDLATNYSTTHIDSADQVFKAMRKHSAFNEYMNSTIDYFETQKYIFVHGWFPLIEKPKGNYIYNPDWRNSDDFGWKSARWYNGMQCWLDGVKEPKKTVVCGHWHCSWGNSKIHNDGSEFPNPRSTNPDHQRANFNPFVDDGIMAIDACTGMSHQVNCVVLEDE